MPFKPLGQKMPNTSPSPCGMWTPSNTPIPQLTPLTTPNSIQIYSAILPQYTLWTDRLTDRPTDGLGDRSVPIPAYALYIDYSDTANNICLFPTIL